MMIFEGFEFWVLSISFEEIGKYDIKANLFLAVQDRSIGDIDSQSLIKSVRLLISASPEHYRLLRDF